MATQGAPNTQIDAPVRGRPESLLEPGDRLSRDEFERRYERMPHVKKAELIEGIVYRPSPARFGKHAGAVTTPPSGSAWITNLSRTWC